MTGSKSSGATSRRLVALTDDEQIVMTVLHDAARRESRLLAWHGRE